MATQTNYPHLIQSPEGKLYIEGTRYTVRHLCAEHYHYGWSAEEILRQHPDLKPEEVYAALTYFYDHHDEIVSELTTAQDTNTRNMRLSSLSREDLLRRRNGRVNQ